MSFAVQGWCPGALRPMQSGDGLVVRIRPPGGRLTQMQAAGIAKAAQTHGNGLIDLSGRANIQLRGVREATHLPLLDDLQALGLIDADIEAETRRNIIVTPFADAETDRLAADLARALADAPTLPGKFGFAIDTGPQRVLAQVSTDIRIERSSDGALILRADGHPFGAVFSDVSQAIALAEWFIAQGGVTEGRGRMAALIARGIAPAATLTPGPNAPPAEPGLYRQGALVGFEFGQMQAQTLSDLATLGPIRATPWRMLLVEGLGEMSGLPGLITKPDDPMRRVVACTGAPGCLQARQATRALARRLAPQVLPGQRLHVSGCAKGCAWPMAADHTLVGTDTGFDLVENATARDRPVRKGQSPRAATFWENR
jgi:precorrin-3B synthase